jgi:O-antigen/teichoic acid export membrane protein
VTTSFLAALRSLGAALLGYLLFAAPSYAIFRVSGQDPHAKAPIAFMAVAVITGMLFACIGGYVAALIAGRRPIAHASATALLLAGGATASLVSTAAQGGAIWSQVAALLLMAPSTVGGGWLRARARRS